VDGVPAVSHGFANPEAVWTYNTQDNGALPKPRNAYRWIVGIQFPQYFHFPICAAVFQAFHPVSSRFSLFAIGDADTSFGKN